MTQEQLDKADGILKQIQDYKQLVQDCSYMLENADAIIISGVMPQAPTFMRVGLNINHKELSLIILRKIKSTYEEWIVKMQDEFNKI